MNKVNLADRILSLEEPHLKQIYSRLLMELEFDEEPILTREDLQAHQEQDRVLLENVATSLQITRDDEVPNQRVAAQLLVVIIDKFPDYRQAILDTLDELDHPSVHLDFGLTIAIGLLVVAVAAAIVRPHVIIDEKTEKRREHETTERKIDVQVQGVEEIAQIIKAILPFL